MCGSDSNLDVLWHNCMFCLLYQIIFYADNGFEFPLFTVDDNDHKNRAVIAASTGDTLELCRLIAEGFDVNTSLNDTTALHIAIEHVN